MNTGEKIDYMIQCLQVVKAEYKYSENFQGEVPEEYESWYAYMAMHRQPIITR